MEKKMVINGVTFSTKYSGTGVNRTQLWSCKKNGFVFEISRQRSGGYYFVTSPQKKDVDIRWNSLWENLAWDRLEDAMTYASTWLPQNHKCLGKDFSTNH